MKSVQLRSVLWSVFSRIRTEYGEILHIFEKKFHTVKPPNSGHPKQLTCLE